MSEIRIEQDLLGEREIPAAALYGIATLRAIENFPIAGRPVHRDHRGGQESQFGVGPCAGELHSAEPTHEPAVDRAAGDRKVHDGRASRRGLRGNDPWTA